MNTDTQMPGAWTCDKCGLVYQKNLLMAATGDIKADTSPLNERCPNDGVLMRPLTWREVNEDLYQRLMLAEKRLRWIELNWQHLEQPLGEFLDYVDENIIRDSGNEPTVTTPINLCANQSNS